MTAVRRIVFAIFVVLASGCSSAAFDVAQSDDDAFTDDAALAPSNDDAGAAASSSRSDRAPHFALAPDAPTPRPDTTTTPDDAGAALDTLTDVATTLDTRVDTGSPSDVATDGICRHACLITGSSGANLPLGSTICTWDGECCSGSCYVVHPGTGEHGTCVAPGGASHWCGGTQEWCPEAVTMGIARCVS